METIPQIEFFKGENWEQCMSFIQAIRSAAWKEGKIRDPAWMADFASLYFSHRALAWHSKLPLEIRQDWFKLEASLVDRWAPADPGEDDGWQIQPAPAAAPMRAGLLKVVLDPFGTPPYVQSNASFYVQFDEVESVICTMTVDDSEYSKNLALRVRCNSRSKVGLLEWSGSSGCSWFAIHWRQMEPLIDQGSVNYASLTIVHADKLQSSLGYKGPWQLMHCTISSQGEVTPLWQGIPLQVFAERDDLLLVSDPVAYSKKYPNEVAAKLVVEWAD